jgi:peptide/nickel transport system permease protein
MIDAILDRDLPVVQNLVALYAVVFVVVNLITDMSYAWLDPRIRYD